MPPVVGYVLIKGESAQAALAEASTTYPFQDVVSVAPDHVDSFNLEYDGWHRHDEDEVRFFESGSGRFFLTSAEDFRSCAAVAVRVLSVCSGSYIELAAGTVHRFQSDPQGFTARRFFRTEGGGTPLPVNRRS